MKIVACAAKKSAATDYVFTPVQIDWAGRAMKFEALFEDTGEDVYRLRAEQCWAKA